MKSNHPGNAGSINDRTILRNKAEQRRERCEEAIHLKRDMADLQLRKQRALFRLKLLDGTRCENSLSMGFAELRPLIRIESGSAFPRPKRQRLTTSSYQP